MTSTKHDQLTVKNLLLPMAVMAFTMALFFVFQLTQVMRDRSFLTQTAAQLETPYAESQKLNAQFGGLVVGTRQLAEQGNATAKELVNRLKQIGVLPNQEATPADSPASVPVAHEKAPAGPVKP
ncbi:MAG: hypothetical protein WC612_06890 [Bdellovibrionales bacterium]|jgi:hypothetical protein